MSLQFVIATLMAQQMKSATSLMEAVFAQMDTMESNANLVSLVTNCVNYKSESEGHIFCTEIKILNPESHNLGLLIPILQVKFYYIPPLEGRFQTFGGIDI